MERKQDYSRPLLFALALAVVIMGIRRACTLDANIALDQTTLLYFLCAGALILLDRVKSIAIGENKLEFQELRNEIAEAKSEARDAKVQSEQSKEVATALANADMTQNRTSGAFPHQGPLADAVAAIFEKSRPANLASEDPWFDYFGKLPATNNGKILTATVTRLSLPEPLYTLRILVRSTQAQSPLTGLVKFYLHPTFSDPLPIREAINGVAGLELIAYGSCTVGAVCADGTELGLNLAEIPGVDEYFKSH
jgi:hypothetical protein